MFSSKRKACTLLPVDPDDVDLEEPVDQGVADATFHFYEGFEDSSALLFAQDAQLIPTLEEPGTITNAILRFVCRE